MGDPIEATVQRNRSKLVGKNQWGILLKQRLDVGVFFRENLIYESMVFRVSSILGHPQMLMV